MKSNLQSVETPNPSGRSLVSLQADEPCHEAKITFRVYSHGFRNGLVFSSASLTLSSWAKLGIVHVSFTRSYPLKHNIN